MKLIAAAVAVLGVAVLCVHSARQDPFYEVLSSWQDAFNGNFCLTAPEDLFGWKIKLHFDQPVTSMKIRRATVRTRSSDSTLYHLGDQFWNARWLTGERNCFDFTATAPGLASGAVASHLLFADIVEPSGCPDQISDQQFSIDITRHWPRGLSGSFCLVPPRDFLNDWKIRVEFDTMLLSLNSPSTYSYNVNNRMHWVMSPPAANATTAVAKGDKFCLPFIAFTWRMIHPCIRAFFTEADGRTPASSTAPVVTSTPANLVTTVMTSAPHANSSSTSQPATSQPAMTVPSTAQASPTQTPTSKQPATQPPATHPPTTQPPTTHPPTTQPPTTHPPTTQPPPTQPLTAAPASGWGGTYTQLSLWGAGVNGRLCLDYTPTITCGWEVDIRFEPAITRLDIWIAQSTSVSPDTSGASIYHLENMSWNMAISDKPLCLEFNAYKSYSYGPQVSGRFVRICSNTQWIDVTSSGSGGSGGTSPAVMSAVPTSVPSVTTSSPGAGPVMTGNVNQDMLDLYHNTYSGDGTYYGEGRGGTCTYHQTDFPAVGLSSQIHALAALNYIKWYNSKACGMCFKVTGEGVGAGNDPLDGEYIVFIKDLCPQGACSLPGSVDFAENKDGRWDIEMQAVQCPVGNNKLQYAFQGTNPWYIKLQISNYRIPPNEVSIKRNGVWQVMTKSSDGYWLLSDGTEMTNTQDIPVRVTAINGEQLSDTIPQLANDMVMNGGQGVQFSLDPNLPSLSAGGYSALPPSPPVTSGPSSASSPTVASATSASPGGAPVMTGTVNQDMLDLYYNSYSGDGTYYGEGRGGTCTYHQTDFPAVGLSSQIHALAALNYIKWYNSKACGMCFKVTGQGVGAGNDPLDGEYIVFIKDLCPQGACSLPGSVDFAENKDGRWDIEMQAVQCPVGNNKLQYAFQGTNPWYIKLQISNYRIPPNEVSIKRNGVWQAMTKSSDGYWLLSDGTEMTNTQDIPVRVTAINGEQLTDTIPQLATSSVVMDGGQGVQFSLDPSLPSVSSSGSTGLPAPAPLTSPPPPSPATSTGAAPSNGNSVMTASVNQDMLDLYSNTFSGDGTYYGEGRGGTCTYHQTDFPAVGLSSQIHALAALNYIKWYNSKACGMCFKVTGQGVGAGNDPLDGDYIVFIKDLCPQGACSLPGSVDFAENKDGRWDIEMQAVQCPVGNNKLQYAFQGTNPWYIKLQVSNYRIPPNEVSIKRNGVWQAMTKSSDGYWLLSDGTEMTNTQDIPVWVTAINGEQLTDTIPQLANNVVMDGGSSVQFSLDPNLPSLP